MRSFVTSAPIDVQEDAGVVYFLSVDAFSAKESPRKSHIRGETEEPDKNNYLEYITAEVPKYSQVPLSLVIRRVSVREEGGTTWASYKRSSIFKS